MKRNWFKWIGLTVFGLSTMYLTSCSEEKKSNTSVKQVVIKFKKEGELQLKKANSDSLIASIAIEIADDEYSTQTGLMYRSSMADDQGMLFIFPNTQFRSFYMKNTQIPLDIIFISEDLSIVSIQKNAKPMDETSLPSEAPAKYVLEVNAGLCETWNLEKGDRISFTKN